MKLTRELIISHPEFEKSLSIVREIMGSFNGYVCHEYIHVLYVIKQLMGDSCKTYLEIGTHNGGSLVTVMQSFHTTKYYGVDVWSNDANRIKTLSNIKKYNKHGHEFELIKGYSTSAETLKTVKEKCKDGIDFLFIDGGHETQTVINDFNSYFNLVNKGGIIVFDDYMLIKDDDENKINESFQPHVKKRKLQVRLGVDEIISKNNETFDIIGLIPNTAGAYKICSGPTFECTYGIDFIIQKK